MRKTEINLKRNIDFNIVDQNSSKLSNIRVTNILDERTTDVIIEEIMEKKNCAETEALMLLSGLLQKGGTNKSAGNSTKFIIGDMSLTAQELQNILNEKKRGATNRQLARALADEIAEISLVLNIEGDLSNQMRYDFPELTLTEAVWCSNFQTTNPNCPENVRHWLVKNYKSRFNR